MTPQHALWLPLFDALADPALVARLAAEAEEAGWHGLFVWDHLRWREPVTAVADPWITLAAIAATTSELRFGPMVSAITRRRPAKLARETATLDRLGGGRLTLGVGLGGDRFGEEFSRTGEECDDRVRARMLDEALEILAAAWSGDVVRHHGEHYTVDGIRFLPTPVRRIPVWAAGFPGKLRPMRRAARLDGYFPVNLGSADRFAEAVAQVEALREGHGPFDYVAEVEPGEDTSPYAAAGATWILTGFDPESLSADHVRGVLREGPRT
ncbi:MULTISPECIES: LLM class flavin-dependent oxidoreductase [unclassified Amycolatopsis]|uniref:LLM class flavin-dependent oxidoreductase n=1 Tax=unclassified Amycolatopsis TaxID=2618356 RepID=UPI0028769E45|nr:MULTISPECIES: LLM class flavin-dependent oxidoreductase [unclassified Amycolatopsis]MDS0136508.1 LLM class flavin-dependent oxidoreductase [Amycolatopsis sp. 505]MDS0146023.1 LLM class flavin-dependent oxidoreductase [Amycolatopsis sp. CM201R]